MSRERVWLTALQWLWLLSVCLGFTGCLGRLSAADRQLVWREQQSRARWHVELAGSPSETSVTAADAPQEQSRVTLPNPQVASLGRIATLVAEAPGYGLRLVWPGSELRAAFSGPRLTLDLRTQGEVHIDVWVDDQHVMLSPGIDKWARYSLLDLGPGSHRLRLQKRTEAAAGVLDVLALELAAGGALLPPPSLPSRRLEFIGDSMTVGACVLNDGAEVWQTRERHCHRLSYAAQVATALQAQHRAIAVSGLGVSRSRVPLLAQDVFDRSRPELTSPIEPAEGYQPDAVVILLGHNDVLAAALAGTAFPPEFVADYVRLVRAVRRRYPASLIVCLTGGMYISRTSYPLRRAFDQALRELQTHDPRIRSHRLAAWSFWHPRAHTQAAIAAELEQILRRELGWRDGSSSADRGGQE